MALQATFRLTEAEIEAFRRDGFLPLDAITSQHEIERLSGIYDDLFDGRRDVVAADRLELAGPEDRPMLPQIMNPDRYAPELLETVALANATVIARQLLGEAATSAGMHAIRKPPHHGAATPWHQDEAYWDPGRTHNAISIWMPLQPATIANGCMQFVRGSQHDAVAPHRLISEDAQGLVVDGGVDEDLVVACPLPGGGATIHNGRTLHYAGPNTTDEPRRALIMAFETPSSPLPKRRDFYWQRPEWFPDEEIPGDRAHGTALPA